MDKYKISEKVMILATLSECLLDKLEAAEDEEGIDKFLMLAYLLNDHAKELAAIVPNLI